MRTLQLSPNSFLMAEFFFDYGLFALKLLTFVAAIIIVVMVTVMAGLRGRKAPDGHIEVKKVNDDIDLLRDTLSMTVVDADEFKIQLKQRHKDEKAERKAAAKAFKKAP